MAEDLTKLWGNFNLYEEESIEVELHEEEFTGIVFKGKSNLVGKPMLERSIGKRNN